jgi:osmotically inducible protein OsmC
MFAKVPPQMLFAYGRVPHEVLAGLLLSNEGCLMKLILRKAAVLWKGGPQGADRDLSFHSADLKPHRAGAGKQRRKNSIDPAELIAAAHASSFSSALLAELRLTGSAPREIITAATVALEQLAAGWTIVNIHLTVNATLPQMTQGEFIDATVRAKTNCVISRLVRAMVSVTAKLE